MSVLVLVWNVVEFVECAWDFRLTLPSLRVRGSLLHYFSVFARAGTNEMLVVSIICGRTNEEMDMIKKRYFDIFTKDLGSVLASETGGSLEILCLNLLQGAEDTMDESVYNDEKMAEDIKTLYEAGQGCLGTKEKEIFKVCGCS